MKILPAILVDNLDEYEKQAENASTYSDEIIVDIIDWNRTENKTISPEQALSVGNNFKIHFDLMIDYTENILDIIDNKIVKSVVLNFEVKEDLGQFIKKVRDKDIKVGVSLNPENKVEDIKYLLGDLDYVQIFTIIPGKQGQPFLSEMLKKANELRKQNFKGEIIVDGGVNKETISEIIKYPVDILSVGSALSKAENPKDTYFELKKIAII